jgi:hypothetical protein
MAKTLEQFFNLARVATTQGHDTDYCWKVARSCMEAQQVGGNVSIWHNVAKLAGNLERCPCHPCTKARQEANPFVIAMEGVPYACDVPSVTPNRPDLQWDNRPGNRSVLNDADTWCEKCRYYHIRGYDCEEKAETSA